jgi:hypothetical protein
MWMVRSLLLLAYTKQMATSDWLLIKRHCIGRNGLPGVQLQNQLDYISYRRDFGIYRKEDVLFQLKIRGRHRHRHRYFISGISTVYKFNTNSMRA